MTKFLALVAALCCLASAARAQQSTPPGEPSTQFASGFGGGSLAMAAALSGDLFVTDYQWGRVARVTPSGAVSTFVQLSGPKDLVFDGFGDLLVSTQMDMIVRVSSSGQRSNFAPAPGAGAITVGPDGDVWVGTRSEIVRYNPLGIRKDAVPLPGSCVGVLSLAFSPTGELHFTSDVCVGVWKVVNKSAERVINLRPRVGQSLAFDGHGWLWASDVINGTLLLFNPAYVLMHDPFITGLGNGPIGLAFLRDTNGKMTPRLLASHVGNTGPNQARIVAMNPDGMGAAGWRVGVDLRVGGAVRGGTEGMSYADTLHVTNAPGAATWTVVAGTMPPGVTLSSTGVLSGTPLADGAFAFVVRAASGGRIGFSWVTLSVAAGQSPGQTSPASVANALLGAAGATLAPALQQLLDQQGNNNGVLDIGDLRAYLRAQGHLP